MPRLLRDEQALSPQAMENEEVSDDQEPIEFRFEYNFNFDTESIVQIITAVFVGIGALMLLAAWLW